MSEGSGYGSNKYGTSPLGSSDPAIEGSESDISGYGLYSYGTSPFGSSDGGSSTLEVTASDSLVLGDSLEVEGATTLKNVVVSDEVSGITESVVYTMPLRVASAGSTGKFGILVTFSQNLNISDPVLEMTSNYLINPLLVLSTAQVVGQNQVLLQTVTPQAYVPYTVTVLQAESSAGESLGSQNYATFQGFSSAPTFKAGVISGTKILLEFSDPMLANANLIDPSSYTILSTLGSVSVPVTSVSMGTAPVKRVTLTLGTPLTSGGYYSVIVGPLVLSSLGVTPQPNTYVVRWNDVRPPREIPISDFSGEVSGGLLGTPEGQVFFSPALENAVTDTSTVEIEEVSVCTRAYDEYHIPDPPDPDPLYLYSAGAPSSLLGQVVLWAPPDRLGQAKTKLADRHSDNPFPPVYVPSTATLESPITDFAAGILREVTDITRAAFLNDIRWKTYPNTGALVFRTADNLTSIPAGPTTQVQLSPTKDVRLNDALVVLDSPTIP